MWESCFATRNRSLGRAGVCGRAAAPDTARDQVLCLMHMCVRRSTGSRPESQGEALRYDRATPPLAWCDEEAISLGGEGLSAEAIV